MSVPPEPSDVVRALVIADFRPAEGSVQIVREERTGEHYVAAVAFEDVLGVKCRGLYGLQQHQGGVWRRNGQAMSSTRPIGKEDVWMTWGGWGGDSHAVSVIGGWVAAPEAMVARAIDETTGRALDDQVESGVALFIFDGHFSRHARLQLLDLSGKQIRTGPLNRRP